MSESSKERYHRRRIMRDFLLITLSVVASIAVVSTDSLHFFLNAAEDMKILASFVAGIFFTSAFTTPLSIIALGELSTVMPIWQVALFGACGALLGDLILFLFIRDNLSEDIQYVLKKGRAHKRLFSIFKFRIFRWLTPLVGAMIIASPLPDELGIAMMGLSKMRLAVLVPISFTMNFLGIVLVGAIANSLF